MGTWGAIILVESFANEAALWFISNGSIIRSSTKSPQLFRLLHELLLQQYITGCHNHIWFWKKKLALNCKFCIISVAVLLPSGHIIKSPAPRPSPLLWVNKSRIEFLCYVIIIHFKIRRYLMTLSSHFIFPSSTNIAKDALVKLCC
jgi:hypothetical protein